MRKLICMSGVLISVLFFGIGTSVGGDSAAEWPAYPGKPGGPSKFIRTDGTLLRTPDGKRLLLRGISFGNHVWSNPSSSERFTHHGPDDYARVKKLGFNSIRFYMNYQLFEDDAKPYVYKQSGFDWLDKNIAAARSAGIYLVLNMHVPQGGFQSNGAGDALWTNGENRARLAALWKEIARRYHDEEIIIGYGLVNEPVPTASCEQWRSLAQDLTDAIRSVDATHILFIERVNWLKFTASDADRENLYFPDIRDPAPKTNIVYEYHMYNPMEFTHQNAGWIAWLRGKFSVYPDPARISTEGEKWVWFSDGNPEAGNGSFGWKNLDGIRVTADKPDYKIGKPVIQAQGIGRNGRLWVDDLIVEEFNPDGKKVRTLTSSVDGTGGWYFWSRNNSGSYDSATGVEGASDGKCLMINGTTDDAVISCDSLKFIIDGKNTYRVSGRVKGENIASGAVVRFRIDYLNCDFTYSWNKAGLKRAVDQYVRFAAAKKVPVYLGEFGVYRDAFVENRGGERWLSDVLDVLTAGNVNYNYHTYHEWGFGIYMNDDKALPDPSLMNCPAAEIFRSKQVKRGVRK